MLTTANQSPSPPQTRTNNSSASTLNQVVTRESLRVDFQPRWPFEEMRIMLFMRRRDEMQYNKLDRLDKELHVRDLLHLARCEKVVVKHFWILAVLVVKSILILLLVIIFIVVILLAAAIRTGPALRSIWCSVKEFVIEIVFLLIKGSGHTATRFSISLVPHVFVVGNIVGRCFVGFRNDRWSDER